MTSVVCAQVHTQGCMYMPADAYAYLDTLFQNSCPFQALALPPPPFTFCETLDFRDGSPCFWSSSPWLPFCLCLVERFYLRRWPCEHWAPLSLGDWQGQVNFQHDTICSSFDFPPKVIKDVFNQGEGLNTISLVF